MKPTSPRSGRILVIDDERFIAELMRDVLTRHGHSVEMYSHGPAALEAVRRSRFDLIISDFAMPGLNGLDFVREVRSSLPATRVVIVSAFLDSETLESLEAEPNFAGFLRKPFDIFDLAELADRWVSGASATPSTHGTQGTHGPGSPSASSHVHGGIASPSGSGNAARVRVAPQGSGPKEPAKDPPGLRTHPLPPAANEGFAR